MNTQKVLVSIDTEAPIGVNGIDSLVLGQTAHGDYGINYMMDVFDGYGIKGLFFVDIAEAWEYGDKKIASVLKMIDKRGHDIGVHIHPDRMADKEKRYLWQYSKQEQCEMIKKCTEFYSIVLGKKPKSFRAGRYGANNDTIDILNELGYQYDLSMFYGMKKRCRISNEYSTINQVKKIDKIVEIPVTVYKSFSLLKYARYDKFDESIPYGEFKLVLSAIKNGGNVDIISYFMHSFSFLEWRKTPDTPLLNIANQRRIIKMLDFMNEDPSIKFICEKDLGSISLENPEEDLDLSSDIRELPYSIARAYRIIRDKAINNI